MGVHQIYPYLDMPPYKEIMSVRYQVSFSKAIWLGSIYVQNYRTVGTFKGVEPAFAD